MRKLPPPYYITLPRTVSSRRTSDIVPLASQGVDSFQITVKEQNRFKEKIRAYELF